MYVIRISISFPIYCVLRLKKIVKEVFDFLEPLSNSFDKTVGFGFQITHSLFWFRKAKMIFFHRMQWFLSVCKFVFFFRVREFIYRAYTEQSYLSCIQGILSGLSQRLCIQCINSKYIIILTLSHTRRFEINSSRV